MNKETKEDTEHQSDEVAETRNKASAFARVVEKERSAYELTTCQNMMRKAQITVARGC